MPQQPSYLRVADAIRAIVADAEPGAQLPPITTLATEHGVSVGVVQRAYKLLVDEELVISRNGAGHYVRARAVPERLMRRQRAARGEGSPTAALLAQQGVVGTWRADSRAEAASGTVAGRLEIEPGEPVMHTSYVYAAEGVPSYLAESWEPMEITGPTMIVMPEAGPYMGLGVADRMAVIGIEVGMPVEIVTTRLMTRAEAQVLGVAPGGPVIEIERTYYDQRDGRPVETADIVLPGARWASQYGERPPRR